MVSKTPQDAFAERGKFVDAHTLTSQHHGIDSGKGHQSDKHQQKDTIHESCK